MFIDFNNFSYFPHQEMFINSKLTSIHSHMSYLSTIALVAALGSTISLSITTEHIQFVFFSRKMTSHESGSIRSPQEAVNVWEKRRCPVKNVLHHGVYGVNKTCDVIRQLPPLLRGGGVFFKRILDPQTVLDARGLCKCGNKGNVLRWSLACCHRQC